jgi:anti-anti-sigma factor
MVRNVEPESRLTQVTSPQQLNAQSLLSLERMVDDAILHKPGGVALNLAGVQSVDSAGLNWLVNLQKRLVGQGMLLVLQDPNALLQDIFTATRLDTRFKMTHSAAGAEEGSLRHG